MDERDYKAMNELKMSNTEETNKLSAEDELLSNKKKAILNCAIAGCYNIHNIAISEKYIPHLLIAMDGFAYIRVEQEKESIRQFLISEGFEMLAEKI